MKEELESKIKIKLERGAEDFAKRFGPVIKDLAEDQLEPVE